MMKLFKSRKARQERRRVRLMEGQDDVSFRRSRTLQGTTSDSVKVVKQRRTELTSERLKQHKARKRRQAAVFAVGCIVFLAVAIWFLASQYMSAPGDIRFTPTPAATPQSSVYSRYIEQYLADHPGQRFRFALDETQLSEYISQKQPEVESVKPAGFLSNKSDFIVSMRKPIASWKSGDSQSYVDAAGVSFSKNYFTTPRVVITDNSGVTSDKSGAAVVSERLLRFLGRLIAIADDTGLGKVTEASLPKSTTRQIDIKIEGKPYTIKTHIDRDPAATVEDIQRVVGYLEQKKRTASYIDVRINGRAFYK